MIMLGPGERWQTVRLVGVYNARQARAEKDFVGTVCVMR